MIMAQMIKMMQEISKALPPKKEDMCDAHNSDHKNPCIIDDHDENYGEIHPELVTKDDGDELNIAEMVFDPIDIITKLTIKLEVRDELTTNMELKLILNQSVEEPIHCLAIASKVPTEDVNKFYSFLSNMGKKSRVTKTSCK
ncbi:hypothetical protein J1N35_001609 [Gossypium stocksii]|uniref:Uncharacterized protein n=1 Tax=Gossypium stocksii TaxID=47602 RepID=A0A9D4ALG5_9ROSI|nr:hypothetical protein J1N35_001609 [Gossypium stocksii]